MFQHIFSLFYLLIFCSLLYIYFQIKISNSETMKYFDGWKMEFMHLLLYLVSSRHYININLLCIHSHISMILANNFSLPPSLTLVVSQIYFHIHFFLCCFVDTHCLHKFPSILRVDSIITLGRFFCIYSHCIRLAS